MDKTIDKPKDETMKNEAKVPSGSNERDRPWVFRTYAGHSDAKASNELYRKNLAKGQTGLSIAFDLPTQTGYDCDHVLARGETGKVGVSVAHIGDMRQLLDQIPLDQMNTSMTINATAPWLLALYIAVADEQGIDRKELRGTTQNDLIKEYLSRGTYIFPPEPSMRLTTDVITYCYKETPKWNPMNVCSYHLQEAGATPVQELSFALATAISILDYVKASGEISDDDFPELVGRISFFVNAGLQFITEMCKMRAFTELWDEICLERYGVNEEKYRRFRYGVQVNSLGLTEHQPENNVYRILLETLAVTLSKSARARAVQLPAWNEALGLPRPWDQQWSLRMQQILAFETDLLSYPDIFDGSKVIEEKVAALKEQACAELVKIETMGGAVKAIEEAYMKSQLVASNAKRLQGIEQGDQIVVGVNAWQQTESSPLTEASDSILTIDENVERERIKDIQAWRKSRNQAQVDEALKNLRQAAQSGTNIMPASIEAAKAGVTTGEWGQSMREVFGEYRAPTGIKNVDVHMSEDIDQVRQNVERISSQLQDKLKILVGKPGLDGHSNGAEQIAVRARDCGMDVIYDGIRLTPEDIVEKAITEKTHAIGLSILSGSHIMLVADVLNLLRDRGYEHIPVIVGGIIPEEDAMQMRQMGVKAVYTPKNYEMTAMMGDIVNIVGQAHQ